jgi:phosphatidylserine/phosphatidylglycerophosphate/cardiolipin synthase-like enzyme
MNTLTSEAAERGVEVNLFFNPSLQYGNTSIEHMDIHPMVNIATVSGSGSIPYPFNQVFGDSYTNHHQKFLLVDDEVLMVGGVGVHPCRAGWLVLNTETSPYYWHEVGVVVPCTPHVSEWVRAMWTNRFMPLPPPLVSGDTEHLTMLKLIETAKACIHMEAQLCISTDTTMNQVLSTVVKRLIRASRTPGDRFRFMMLVNTHQPDEHMLVSSVTTSSLHWSRRMLMSQARKAGLSPLFIRERVFIGTLEHKGVHIKVHSNLIIQDGHTMIRTSSNLTDRSLSVRPCDNELGIFITGSAVAVAQQALWKRYFMRDCPDMYPSEAFRLMVAETGLVRAVNYHSWCDTTFIPDVVVDFVMRTLHKTPFFGGKENITWETHRV